MMPWQSIIDSTTTFSDTNWAGDKITMKSSSDGTIRLGNHTLKTWSKTQSVVALSSAESELYGVVKATAEAPGTQSLLRDLGMKCRTIIKGYASAVLDIVGRRDLGKVRYIDTSHLWIQQTAAGNRAKFQKVEDLVNPADLITKALAANMAHEHMESLGQIPTAGRSQIIASDDIKTVISKANSEINENAGSPDCDSQHSYPSGGHRVEGPGLLEEPIHDGGVTKFALGRAGSPQNVSGIDDIRARSPAEGLADTRISRTVEEAYSKAAPISPRGLQKCPRRSALRGPSNGRCNVKLWIAEVVSVLEDMYERISCRSDRAPLVGPIVGNLV